MRVLGFMSGTSLDGVDAAIIETDGVRLDGLGPAHFAPFTPKGRAIPMAATEAIVDGRMNAALEAEAEAIIFETHLRTAAALVAPGQPSIDLVGFHGQTVLHRPERRQSRQLGDAGALARRLGVPVIADLRQADRYDHGRDRAA